MHLLGGPERATEGAEGVKIAVVVVVVVCGTINGSLGTVQHSTNDRSTIMTVYND
jgi:hypothetical protein